MGNAEAEANGTPSARLSLSPLMLFDDKVIADEVCCSICDTTDPRALSNGFPPNLILFSLSLSPSLSASFRSLLSPIG